MKSYAQMASSILHMYGACHDVSYSCLTLYPAAVFATMLFVPYYEVRCRGSVGGADAIIESDVAASTSLVY